MPRTLGSKKLTPEKKAAVALFLVDLAARGTRAVDAVKEGHGNFQAWEYSSLGGLALPNGC
ncbi:hypothetical protein PC129_g15657 [Phytophthora cactorum]|uniref:Uncharacterized protein n=1 Tax=Phytophthora cactorum TaxID=29920 RepID=A0A8T1K2S2_9STRA|nr:hypothetical protein Pcac1_g15165 [Phytophthora cactorum]KAG2810742.1 hypothetical protein PC111_g15521 [Phytophthora cactorum]KAG2849876.1 hypothetical protein PC113_g17302 [Phytophthora cactorum]KAG2887309.1 hypothetical protein PC114_g18867 [Phytophthora cactorum]KAG2924751.1 hypothetical protein PC117_g15329 [Phytophthora cactorum]